jgi:hypothetical protein
LAAALQRHPPSLIAGLPTAGTRSNLLAARSAGYQPGGENDVTELTLKTDHSAGAGQRAPFLTSGRDDRAGKVKKGLMNFASLFTFR